MVVQYGHADVWQRPGLVRGMENFMLDLAVNPEFCHYLSNMFTDFYIEEYSRAQAAADGRITIFNLYSDLGSQLAPLISRDMLREFVLPYIRRFADHVHDNLNGKVFFHTCGMVYPYIGDLIDSGIDILDPIQPCSPEMQPENLAKEFGGRVCFHGGINIQNLLVRGTPQDVRDAVKRYADCFRDGGYICAATHFLQADTPVENILALYEEVSEF
jgi:uroporphyrinogen decarboxylase